VTALAARLGVEKVAGQRLRVGLREAEAGEPLENLFAPV